jgi:acetate kinase
MSRSLTVFAVNAGSSSLKIALYAMGGEERLLARGEARGINSGDSSIKLQDADGEALISEDLLGRTYTDAFRRFSDILGRSDFPPPDAVGHRLVHGGAAIDTHRLVTPALLGRLREIIPLAPLHLPTELALIDACESIWPGILQAACFDTAFHRSMPAVAQRLPLPRRLHDEGVQRYGFHGISYEYVLSELGDAARGRVIIAHLGAGASLAAVRGGIPVDTTMSMTPAGGLMMATRSGDVDPGVLIYLMNHRGYDSASLQHLVDRESGLLGVSGVGGDMHSLLDSEDSPAREAVDLFCYIARKHVGAMAAALGGVDTLVFTAGIGEHSPIIRSRICDGLEHLGVELDEPRNEHSERLISSPNSVCEVRVIPTQEELTTARHTARLIGDQLGP